MTGTEILGGQRPAAEPAGTEDCGGGLVRHFQAIEQIANGRFVGGDQPGGFGGELEMKIADRPADPGRGGGREVERDFDDGFFGLVDDVARGGGLENGFAVLERCGELDRKSVV